MILNSIVICSATVIPVRSTNDDRAEIVTQLLFGELARVKEIKEQWVKIEIAHDHYLGWVDSKQLMHISEAEVPRHQFGVPRIQTPIVNLTTPWGPQQVLAGSPLLSKEKKFTIQHHTFEWDTIPTVGKFSIVEIANTYLNAPYLWGGRTRFGIDCSGFTQTVYHQANISIDRDASQQVLQGLEIDFNQQHAGDLAFFKSEKSGRITHVGIVLDGSKIIHAHGRVRIDTLTRKGIYDEEQKRCSHKLFNIKRYT